MRFGHESIMWQRVESVTLHSYPVLTYQYQHIVPIIQTCSLAVLMLDCNQNKPPGSMHTLPLHHFNQAAAQLVKDHSKPSQRLSVGWLPPTCMPSSSSKRLYRLARAATSSYTSATCGRQNTAIAITTTTPHI